MESIQTQSVMAGALGVIAALGLVALGEGLVAYAADRRATAVSAAERAHEAPENMPKGVIGVSLHVGAERVGDPAVLYVAHVHPEGPAHQAGLAHGDEVSAVDGTAVTGKTYEQVVMMIRGEVGAAVKLAVKGERGAREVSITRVASDTLYKGGMGDKGSHESPTR